MERIAAPVIAGNWKMNKGPQATRAFFSDLLERCEPGEGRRLLFFPPAVSLAAAADATSGRADILVGVQNLHWERAGAFTGETSGSMAREAGAACALVGHSERRHIFGETDEQAGRKVAAAFNAGLIPVLCIGETLEERRAGRLRDVLLRQLRAGIELLDDGRAAAALVAYEPVWAIGTGETATPEDAAAAHALIRAELAGRLGADTAAGVPILYGGSVKPDNAAELLAAPDLDGVLVGGASLEPASFAAIADAAG